MKSVVKYTFTERVSTRDVSGIEISNPFPSDYKLLWIAKREFLAIPNGWRRIDILFKIYNILKTI